MPQALACGATATSAATAVWERTTFMNCSPSCSSSHDDGLGRNEGHAAMRIEAVTWEFSFPQTESLDDPYWCWHTKGFPQLHRDSCTFSPSGFLRRRAVGSNQVSVASEKTARFVNTRIISRRYSGVRAEVVNGFAVWAARTPAASAHSSVMRLPAKSSVVPFTSTGAGFTAVSPTRTSSMIPLDRFRTTATPASG